MALEWAEGYRDQAFGILCQKYHLYGPLKQQKQQK